MKEDIYDMVVVGAGLVGLASAMELLKRHPTARLLVLEKESVVASQQSGHNSGVIHSGIYYAPHSLKAQTCVAGRKLLLAFCDQHRIPYTICGKLIVATDERELKGLHDIYERGVANGVEDIRLIGSEEITKIEPHATGIKAIYVGSAGIIDYGHVAHAYAEEVKARGGVIQTDCAVTAIDKRTDNILITTTKGQIVTRNVLTCGGLYSDKLAKLSGAPDDMRIVPFRGDYYILKKEKSYLCKALIYPVPDANFPFLGVHYTRRMDGSVWVGPNAVLAFARKGYGRLDINIADLWNTLSYKGFWKMAKKYWRAGFAEMYRDYVKSAYVKTMQVYVPEVTADDIESSASGVRAQALSVDGKLMDDFSVYEAPHVLHIRNAPSPAATASLAIAKLIADKAERVF